MLYFSRPFVMHLRLCEWWFSIGKWNGTSVTISKIESAMWNRQYVVRTLYTCVCVCVYDTNQPLTLLRRLAAPFYTATHIEHNSTRATRTHAIIHIQPNYNKFGTGFFFHSHRSQFPSKRPSNEMQSDRTRSSTQIRTHTYDMDCGVKY